ncbi:VOC family protein [Sporocytophaga myxococcoides]|uniref:VOC family protein n=1 Tax=Sporocytophaga myxococcoides TaxID=153721 RepID=UPI0004277BF4|nr:glyoxalase/bleomycin resistance/extradiol dioxygenase family protein [Sporocytophaga myxococcoides]
MQPEISLLVLKTRQLQLLIDFYSTLGLFFQEEKHGNGPIHFSCSIGKFVLEIYPLPKSIEIADNTTRLGFSVNNLDEVIKKLRDTNFQIISEPANNEWGYSAIAKDPDGRVVELTGR